MIEPDLRNADPVWMRTERTSEGYVTRLRFSWPRNVNTTSVGTVKSIEERLAEEHLDARFERVRRRWEAKHPTHDVALRATLWDGREVFLRIGGYGAGVSIQPTVVMSHWDNREIF